MGPRIVVGIDGSVSSMRALAWAAAEAELRGVALEVVHVDFARQVALEALAPDMLSVEQSILDRAVVRAKSLAPNVPVTGRRCDPPAGKALVAVSEGAELLVVGSRGVTDLRELTLGSVSSECAHDAFCPVVIIPPEVRHLVLRAEGHLPSDSSIPVYDGSAAARGSTGSSPSDR